jgi:probable rRNA maturation factor
MTTLSYAAVAGGPHLRFAAYLKRWLPKAVGLVPKAPAQISIALVGDRKMAAIHEKFRHVPGPTDVLTFELDHDGRSRVTAGEVIICVPYAQREAKRRDVGVRHEILLYALHGVLHLSGYDDRTAKDHARIHKEEDRILQQIGIGPVFDRAPKERDRSKIVTRSR